MNDKEKLTENIQKLRDRFFHKHNWKKDLKSAKLVGYLHGTAIYQVRKYCECGKKKVKHTDSLIGL